MSNSIESMALSSESLVYPLSGQENFQNSLGIDAVSNAFQDIIQQLQHYATLSTSSSQLEEIYGLQESEKLSELLTSWASGILVHQPSISLLEDALLHGAQGAYAADNNHIYIAKSLAKRDTLTGLNQVLLEEYGHALDIYFNTDQDTLGDEDEWFSLVVSGVSLTRQEVLRLQNEKDQSTLWIDNHSVTVEQSTTSLDFNGDQNSDILWRDAVSGHNAVWFMGGTNNTQIVDSVYLTTVGGSWDIKGISDFNGDNRPDILWRDAVSGHNAVWFMGGTNNAQIVDSAYLTAVGGSWDPILANWMPRTQPDLVVTNQYAPTSVTVGNSITVSAYTKNQGTGTADTHYLRYYLSNDTTLSSNDYSLGNSYVGSLATGSSEYDSLTFNYSSSWGTGTKYILFQADSYGYVSESNESNNIAYRAISINPPPQPDLVITSQYAPMSAMAGNSITVSAYTKNQGTGTASQSYVRYWFSDDTTLSSDDHSLGHNDVGALAVGSSEYDSITFRHYDGWGTGTKYILFQTDSYGSVSESNENNNIAYRAITINPSPRPDLVVTNQYAPTSTIVGSSITLSADTKNQGNATATYSYLRYWLSNDTTVSSDDYSLGRSYVGSLSAGSSEHDGLTFTYDRSWGTGNKYILFQADGYGYVFESNESNNVAYRSITVNPPTQPDLVITNQYAPTSADVGDSITVNAYTKNQGTGTAGSHALRYYLSNDTTLSSDDYDLGYDSVASLTAGSSEYDSFTFIYSSSWGIGTKYILFQADGYNKVGESSESNNIAYQAITINSPPQPDLVVTNQYAPTSVNVGDSITISGYSTNQGIGTAGSHTLSYWLSNDGTFDAAILLGYDNVGSLAAGSSEYHSLTFTYNSSWGTGAKYIFFQADSAHTITESIEYNNVSYKAITINAPTQPDLVVTNQYAPTSATVGDSITVSAYTKNQGTGTAGAHYLRYYLSNDTTISSDDYDLGYDSVASLAAGSSESDFLTFTYSSSWGTGTKYILFQADGYSNVSESNEGNNVIHAAISIQSNLDWYDTNLLDSGLITLTRSLASDGKLSRNDMIAIFRDAKDSSLIDSNELTDLRKILGSSTPFTMADYVKVLSNKIANSDPANTRSGIGNLYSGSSDTQMESLVGKWFLGTDRPDLTNPSLYTYRLASGSLFQNGIVYTDINQGAVGNCYFLAGLANTAFRSPTTIQNMFIDNGDGTYTVRFYNSGVADYVTVDKYLPTTSWNSFIYAHQASSNWGYYNDSTNELWVMLAEKAYAQMNESGWLQGAASGAYTNSYSAIASGYGGGAIEDITGLDTTYDTLTTSDFTAIVNAYNSGKMVYFGSKDAPVNSNIEGNHGYVLVGYNASTQIFTLYNPWGEYATKPGHVYLSINDLAANYDGWYRVL